jgi:hypothetical protein
VPLSVKWTLVKVPSDESNLANVRFVRESFVIRFDTLWVCTAVRIVVAMADEATKAVKAVVAKILRKIVISFPCDSRDPRVLITPPATTGDLE